MEKREKKEMKIVLFGPTQPFRGGVPLFTGVLCEALRKAGHEVKIVGFAKLFPRWLFPGKSQTDEGAGALLIDAERVFVAWKPGTWKQTARAIEAFEPDLILAMWWLPTFGPGYRAVARALPEKYRERLVYVIHDVVSHERRPGDAALARMALRTARKFLVLSLAEGKRLRDILPEVKGDDIHFAPHPPYDHYRPFPGTMEEARRQMGVRAGRVLLFFGFVRRYKGLDLLLEAMPDILKDNAETELLVCGPFHESRAKHEKRMAALGIREHVIIHDRYFSGDDVGVCFAAADAVVLPYRSATQSGVIPVAIALTTPVIATRAGGLDEAIGGKPIGEIISAMRPQAIAEAVRRFYDAGGRAAYEENVRAEAKRQSWDEMVRVIEKLYPHPWLFPHNVEEGKCC
jgi:D-inositol-3-phosphate glycosyltransferase